MRAAAEIVLRDAREKFVLGWSRMGAFLPPFRGFGCVGSGGDWA